MTFDERLARQAIELARLARQAGNHPFGALLALNGTVLLTAQNTIATDGDPTAHAESNLVAEAIRQLTPDQIRRGVLYSSCEPCAMCVGKMYWAGVRSVVYALPSEQLAALAARDFVVSHRTSVAMTTELADLEFARLRARFADEQPLLDMSRREGSGVATRTAGTTPLRSVHTVIFDTRGSRRLVRTDVPYWFARRFAGRHGEFRWLGQSSLDDIERHGPGLIADSRHAAGGQFMSWLE